jgi:hypothetical protein
MSASGLCRAMRDAIHGEPEIGGGSGEGTGQSLDIVSSALETVEEAE